MPKASSSDEPATIDDPKETFELPSNPDTSLRKLAADGGFDDIHFFIEEALEKNAIDVEPAPEQTTFALIPYEHPEDAVDEQTFELIDDAGWKPATFRDLLEFAVERPDVQRDFDVIAPGTLRTRKVYDDKEGETVWDQTELDESICQWSTGLSNRGDDRTLIPVQIFLDDVLRKDAVLLVRK